MKILVFGNILVKEDNLALKLTDKLKQEFSEIEFIEADPTEDLRKFGRSLIILDVVKPDDLNEVNKFGEVRILEDIDKIETSKVYSMHDFDLGYNLKLLKKLDMLDSVKIICIPMGMDEGKAFEGVRKILFRKCIAKTPSFKDRAEHF